MSTGTPTDVLVTGATVVTLDDDWPGPDVVGAHWTYCTASDIGLPAERGVHMAHCPANSSRRGPHRVPIGRILEAGANVALGTDNMTEDMFQAIGNRRS